MGVKTFNKANASSKQIEVYQDFSGGINTELADSATKDNQFRKLINFDMDKAGSISKRPGLYRIPGVTSSIKRMLDKKVKEGILTQDDLLSLEIKDCEEFYDGSHWVFNYITNIGLIVIILNQSMHIPLEEDLLEDEYILFYRGSYSTNIANQALGNRIRISKFNDAFVMYSSLYTQTATSDVENLKQIKLFSWNPVREDYKQIDGTILKVRPRWVEASDDPDDIIINTQYGDSEISIINSNSFGWLINEDFLTSLDVKLKPGKYISPIFSDYSFFEVSYDEFSSRGLLKVKAFKGPLRFSSQWTVAYEDKSTINPSVIYQIVPNTLPNFSPNSVNIHLEKNDSKCYLINVEYTDPSNLVITHYKLFSKGDSTPTILPAGKVLDYGKYERSEKVQSTDAFLGVAVQQMYNAWDFDGYYKRKGLFRNETCMITSDGVLVKEVNHTFLERSPKYLIVQIANKPSWPSKYNDPVYYTAFNASMGLFNPGSLLQLKNLQLWNGRPMERVRTLVNWDFWEETAWGGQSWYINIGGLNAAPGALGYADYTFFNGASFLEPQHHNYKSFDKTGVNRFSNWLYRGFLTGAIAGYDSYVAYDQPVFDQNNYLNIDYNKTQFGIGSGHYDLSINDKPFSTLRSAIITDNSFKYQKVTEGNILEYLPLLGIPIDQFLQSKKFFGYQIYSELQLDSLREMGVRYAKGAVTKMKLVLAYKSFVDSVENGISYLDSFLQIYNIDEFVAAATNTITPSFVIKGIKISNVLAYLKVYWINPVNSEEILLFSLDNSVKEFASNPQQFLENLKLQIVYEWLPSGFFDRVLSFKQLVYTKPNLSDLRYLWYNLNLFSKYNASRYPDIYNETAHPNISWDLVSYPSNTLLETRSIELFGIVPVNNIVLAPGKQRFQLFYNLADKGTTETLIAAITAMSISDYTSMIASSDFSTDGKDGTQSPDWKPFESAFTLEDDQRIFDPETKEWVAAPKKAVFELDIPSTQKPYMVLIQVANKKPDEDKDKGKPIIASLVEVKIEMSPEGSIRTKLEIVSLFDEYTATLNLASFSSYLLSYGSSNKLFLSDVATPSYFPLSNIITMKTPEAIQGCTVFQGKLIVSTENSKSYIGGSSFDSSTDPLYLKEISSDSGLWAKKSEVPMGNYLYFLDTTGIKILKNLYGTADKEFAFETIDTIIQSQVPRDRDACATSFNNKYYICFPNYKYMLVYNFEYKAWVSYEGLYLNFTKMFVNNGELFGIDKDSFAIYKFDENVYVDNWNEIEYGYEEYKAPDGTIKYVQKGYQIKCVLQTKNFDQAYEPHRKKYDWALLNATIEGGEIEGATSNATIKGVTSEIIPYILVDDNLINYKFSFYKDTNKEYNYIEDTPESILMRDDSVLSYNTVVDSNRLGNNNNSYYNIPIQRSGNTIAFGFEHIAPSGLTINSLSIRYSLRDIKKNRRGIS